MFHIELRQFPHKAWRFNLDEPELRAVAIPWAREEWIEFGERKWNPHEAEMTILEGPELEAQEMSLGRGWRVAQRRSEDITERVLATVKQADAEAARARELAPAAAGAQAPAAAALSDPLALGVQLASLLGAQPAQLLAAWQRAAASSPASSPSETLAAAERALAGADGNPG